jgi:predicted ATPase
MHPSAIHFKRYRAFEKEQTLDLLPLTLVIGKNGGGKSVISRLPMLLAGGLQANAEAPLALETAGLTHANRYEDLVFQRSAQAFMLGASVRSPQGQASFVTTLRHVVENHSLGIEKFELFENDKPSVTLTISDPIGFAQSEAQYEVCFDGGKPSTPTTVKFTGLFPTSLVDRNEASEALLRWEGLFRDAFSTPCYLGPFRSETGALARVPRQGVHSLGARGEEALDLLGDDMLRGTGSLAIAVQDWFDREMRGNSIILQRDGYFPRVLVHDPLRNLDVELSETGAGFAQVFPVVVQALALRSRILTSELAIVEQPELHLHPVAHGSVADLIVDTVVHREGNVRYVVETHSEQIVTRVRRRVAEGRIAASDVQIVSVGHVTADDDATEPLRLISLDEDGTPSSWPSGVFEEAFDDLKHIRKALSERTAEQISDVDSHL